MVPTGITHIGPRLAVRTVLTGITHRRPCYDHKMARGVLARMHRLTPLPDAARLAKRASFPDPPRICLPGRGRGPLGPNTSSRVHKCTPKALADLRCGNSPTVGSGHFLALLATFTDPRGTHLWGDYIAGFFSANHVGYYCQLGTTPQARPQEKTATASVLKCGTREKQGSQQPSTHDGEDRF